jgi:hypothetical protein
MSLALWFCPRVSAGKPETSSPEVAPFAHETDHSGTMDGFQRCDSGLHPL